MKLFRNAARDCSFDIYIVIMLKAVALLHGVHLRIRKYQKEMLLTFRYDGSN